MVADEKQSLVEIIAVPEKEPYISMNDSTLLAEADTTFKLLIERDQTIRSCDTIEIKYDYYRVQFARSWPVSTYERTFGWWHARVAGEIENGNED